MQDRAVFYTATLYYLTTFQLMELSSTAMARDVEESSHRTAFNSIHFMALKRTTKRSQSQVQSKHEGWVSSSICDICLNSGSSYLGCGTLPILTQLTKGISHSSYVTTQLLNGFCISGQCTFGNPLWVLQYLSDTFLTHTPSQSQWVLQTAEISAEDSNPQGSYVLLLLFGWVAPSILKYYSAFIIHSRSPKRYSNMKMKAL